LGTKLSKTIFKPLHYYPVYEDYFRRLKDSYDSEKVFKLLEIGIAEGGSLELWGKILKNMDIKYEIVGVDIDESSVDLKYDQQGIYTYLSDAKNKETMLPILQKHFEDGANLIIDDGSHCSKDIIGAFDILFKDYLKDGGTYIIEDLHTSYWEELENDELSATNFVRNLIDAQNFWALRDTNDRYNKTKKYHNLIRKMELYDGLVLINKGSTYQEISDWSLHGKSQNRLYDYSCPIGDLNLTKLIYGNHKRKSDFELEYEECLNSDYLDLFHKNGEKNER